MRRCVMGLAAVAAVWSALPAAELSSASLEALEEKNRELEQRLEALETARASEKGVLEMSAPDTVLSVGGRIQFDAFAGWPESLHRAGSVPTTDEGETGQLGFTARDSRFWVKTRTPSRYGMVRSLIETDFYGDTTNGNEKVSNSYGMRLRHAYVQIGAWTAGQTNSLFNIKATPDTLYDIIDFTIIRQPMVSYGWTGEKWRADLSLEQPETTLYDATGKKIAPGDDRYPDVGARLRWFPEWGEAGMAGMVRYIRQDRATAADTVDAATAWGVNLYGSVRLGNGDDIRLGGTYGDGIGRYLGFNAFPAGWVDASGAIELQKSYGGHLGYRHWWNDRLRSTLAFSYAGTDNPEALMSAAASVTESTRSVQANLLWSPVARTLVGMEYARVKRELFQGGSGETTLVRTTLRYHF